MSKDKATDKELGALHRTLAKSMGNALEASDQADMLIEEFGEELPTPVLRFLMKQVDINPSLLTAVAKFLKDNDITCAIEDSEEQSDLAKRLSKKRKTVGNVTHIDED